MRHIRVASVPAGHPYVRHLEPLDGPSRVRRLPDPRPRVPDPLPGQWWPPAVLEPGWVSAHADEFDVMHVHFGFETSTPAQLRAFLAELAGHGKPLVFTAHDLVNPHLADQRRHREHLDLLMAAAGAVLTLTGAAARVIGDTWGRAARVLPHPHLVPLHRLPGPAVRPAGRPFTIGVTVKARAQARPVPLLRALRAAVTGLDSAVLLVDADPVLARAGGKAAERFRGWVADAAADPRVRVRFPPRRSDEALEADLAAVDLVVLPYRFGTHSGWLETCVDLGTAVVAPDTGCFADQHGHPTYRWLGGGDPGGSDAHVGDPDDPGADDELDGPALVELVRTLARDPGPARPPRPDRAAQRRMLAAAHEELYRDLLG